MRRRSFLRFVGGLAAAAAVAPVVPLDLVVEPAPWDVLEGRAWLQSQLERDILAALPDRIPFTPVGVARVREAVLGVLAQHMPRPYLELVDADPARRSVTFKAHGVLTAEIGEAVFVEVVA